MSTLLSLLLALAIVGPSTSDDSLPQTTLVYLGTNGIAGSAHTTSNSFNRFERCGSSTTRVNISKHCPRIHRSAFRGCRALTTVHFDYVDGTMQSIGARAFAGCIALGSVVLPETLVSIEAQAFYGCTGLFDIILPQSLVDIGPGIFEGCISLLSVNIPHDDAARSRGDGTVLAAAVPGSHPARNTGASVSSYSRGTLLGSRDSSVHPACTNNLAMSLPSGTMEMLYQCYSNDAVLLGGDSQAAAAPTKMPTASAEPTAAPTSAAPSAAPTSAPISAAPTSTPTTS